MTFEDVVRLINAMLAVWCACTDLARLFWYIKDYRNSRDRLRFNLTLRIVGELFIFGGIVWGNVRALVVIVPLSPSAYVVMIGLALLAFTLPAVASEERQILRNWDRRVH